MSVVWNLILGGGRLANCEIGCQKYKPKIWFNPEKIANRVGKSRVFIYLAINKLSCPAEEVGISSKDFCSDKSLCN